MDISVFYFIFGFLMGLLFGAYICSKKFRHAINTLAKSNRHEDKDDDET